MNTLRYKSNNESVRFLEEILVDLGYKQLKVNSYFSKATDWAIRDFQKQHQLVIDGIVGPKTWAKLIEAHGNIHEHNDKFLSEGDVQAFATKYNLEIAVVKAVNEIESLGKGFLANGKPKILFEGHVFWKRLKARGVDPKQYVNQDTATVLYARWTRKHYLGGAQEYDRLATASMIHKEAALESCSWGAFQIMGYHWESLGYASVSSFVTHMKKNEAAHLEAFGRFIKKFNLLDPLRAKNWRTFARGYNGSQYATHHYHTRLEKAYKRYNS